ncbi:hypothetical protein [Microbacterium sp. NPDC080220]|uniref:hypothetical protein n=1 Tax=Microbacterium sp. NPDC080220 TaxID=3161017 RepID=UPI0034244A93
MSRDYPLTSSDLRHIADKVDEVLAVVNPEDGELPDGDWRWGLKVTIWNQDGGDDDIAGEIAPYGDGWLGFYPNAIGRPQ